MPEELGKLLREHRERMKLTRAQLARRAGISASFVTYLEQGRRRPSAVMLARLTQALGLRTEQQRKLMQAAGYSEAADLARESGLQLVMEEMSALSAPEREELAAEIHRLIGRWQELRVKSLRKVVIPLAGWQPRLLSPDQLGQMLHPALKEVALAGFKEIVLVLAPGKPVPKLDSPRSLKIRHIVQEPQLGLGHAILITQGLVGDEPFAVLLPDDIMLQDGALCLQQMKSIYEHYRCSVLAVTKAEGAADFKNYGVVQLEQPPDDRVHFVIGLQEKPTTSSLKSLTIVGRYILTPQIFEAIQATRPDSQGELQLTDALNLLLQRQRICAYLYEGRLFRVTPIKMLLEHLIETLDDQQPGRLERAMKITKNALHELMEL